MTVPWLAVVLAVTVLPVAAVWLPTRGVDPVARAVLALGAVLVLDTLVAELMLATGTWTVTGGALAVAATSVLLGAGLEIGRRRGVAG